MSRAAIIGAGISGLASARILREKGYDVTIFEKEQTPGGLIRCDVVQGVLYHKVGGHVFNSKDKNVLDWFWHQMPDQQAFHKATRHAVVALTDGVLPSYPIENHLYQLPEPMCRQILHELLHISANGYGTPKNFDEFLRARFGQTLYDVYFSPYNAKIWQSSLTDIPLDWLEGKLPMPTVEQILQANICRKPEQDMVHNTFNYPNQGGSQYIADTLAQGLDIRYSTPATQLALREGRWSVNGENFDDVVYCANIKHLPALLSGDASIDAWSTQVQSLRAHGTTSVLCQVDTNPFSWIYLPSRAYDAHRIICTGNFSPTNAPAGFSTATIEFSGKKDKSEILEQLELIPFLPRYLAHHYEPYTYPIQSGQTRQTVRAIKDYLQPKRMHLIGRFAEWEYYNMDAAIGAALHQLL